jgi:DNA-binding MarR family transcriptional regulator
MPPTIDQYQYQRLLEWRIGLRRFLHWSEEQAKSHDVTAAQHQLLLAIRGHDGAQAPTVSEVAKALVLRHHSAVGLVDRAQRAGLVRRRRDPEHHALVHLELTETGTRKLDSLTQAHLAELEHIAPALEALRAAAVELPAAATSRK